MVFQPSEHVDVADVGDRHRLPFPQPIGVNDEVEEIEPTFLARLFVANRARALNGIELELVRTKRRIFETHGRPDFRNRRRFGVGNPRKVGSRNRDRRVPEKVLFGDFGASFQIYN